ncbi:hypothetical protein [Planosporangium mesophilum]|nr:hypothetical protein [Planosporangium mesophilum]NJC82505.1 hypothetical protein [Planosporangium mesophilum]
MPPRLPVPARELVGRVLRLAPGDCQYIDYPLTLRVACVRVEISLWYGGDWAWVEGDALDASGRVIARTPALVSVAALARPQTGPSHADQAAAR